MRRAWGKFCSAISTVSWYCCLSSRMASMVRLTRTGARPTEGSSIRRMRGASIRARPRASICCSPPLMEPASWRRRSAKRGKAEIHVGLDLGAGLGPERAQQEIFLNRQAREQPAALGHQRDAEIDDLVG